MPREIDSVPTFDGEKLRWSDFVKPFEFPDKEWQLVRPVGPVWTDYRHTVTTKNGKRYVEYCHAWDSEREDFVNNREEACECCRVQLSGVVGTGGSKILGQYRYYINVFHFMENEEGDMKNQGIFLLEMSSSLFKRIQELKKANGNFPVTHAERGAMILIKFDKNQDAANMYAASLDTKNSPLMQDMLSNSVVQKYPDGSKKRKDGDGRKPAMWDYIRTVSSREEMRKSLRVQGYFSDVGSSAHQQSSSPSRGFQDFSRQPEVDFGVDDDMPETKPLAHVKAATASRSAVQDESPAPRPKKTVEAKPAPYENCPTAFGDFAGSADCYSLCKANMLCREETDRKSSSRAASVTSKSIQTSLVEDDDVV